MPKINFEIEISFKGAMINKVRNRQTQDEVDVSHLTSGELAEKLDSREYILIVPDCLNNLDRDSVDYWDMPSAEEYTPEI